MGVMMTDNDLFNRYDRILSDEFFQFFCDAGTVIKKTTKAYMWR